MGMPPAPCNLCASVTNSFGYEVIAQSRSASAQKTGFAEFAPYVSTPPRLYKVKTVTFSQKRADTYGYGDTGGGICCDCSGGEISYAYDSGFTVTYTYDPSTATTQGSVSGVTATCTWHQDSISCTPTGDSACGPSWDCGDPSPAVDQSGSATLTPTTYTTSGVSSYQFYSWNKTGTCQPDYGDFCTDSTVVSATKRTGSDTLSDGSRTCSEDLSSEYTTSDVKSACSAKLSTATWANGIAQASFSVSTDEKTVMMGEAKYYLHLNNPNAAHCKMRLEWDEVFTPSGGGASTVLAHRTCDWDLGKPCRPVDVTDDTHDSAEYTLSVPTTPGTVSLQNFVKSYPTT